MSATVTDPTYYFRIFSFVLFVFDKTHLVNEEYFAKSQNRPNFTSNGAVIKFDRYWGGSKLAGV